MDVETHESPKEDHYYIDMTIYELPLEMTLASGSHTVGIDFLIEAIYFISSSILFYFSLYFSLYFFMLAN